VTLQTEEDITMFRFLQRFVRDSRARRRGTGPLTCVRRRNYPLNCEALDSRQLLSGYYIVNAASGKVLDDPNFSLTNGAVIKQWQLNGGLNRRWNFSRLSNGNYAITNQTSQLALADPEFSTGYGAGMVQSTWNGESNQQWQLDSLGNGNYEIVNAFSQKVLDGAGGGNGATVVQFYWLGGLNEQWELLAAGNAPAVTDYIVNSFSFQALDDPNFSTGNGVQMDQWQWNGGLNQQ
jgi:Ricin-type beta-trefoil lectin domain-like